MNAMSNTIKSIIQIKFNLKIDNYSHVQHINDIFKSMKSIKDQSMRKVTYVALFEWLRILVTLTDDAPSPQLGASWCADLGECRAVVNI